MRRRLAHLDEGYVFNSHGKTKAASRKLPRPRRAADVLCRRLNEADGEYVLPATRWGTDTSDVERAYRTQLAKGEVGLEEKKRAPLFSAATREFLAWSELEHAAHPATHRRYETSSKALLKFFGDTPLDEIAPDDVDGGLAAVSADAAPASDRCRAQLAVRSENATQRMIAFTLTVAPLRS